MTAENLEVVENENEEVDPRPPGVLSALDAHPGALHLELTMGVEMEGGARAVHVVMRPATVEDEIGREVELSQYVLAAKSPDEQERRQLETRSQALRTAALLHRCIVYWEGVALVSMSTIRALNRVDLNMLSEGLMVAEELMIKEYEEKKLVSSTKRS